MRSAVHFILLGVGIQAEYRQTNMAPEYNKKWRAFRPLLYTFGGVGNRAEYIKQKLRLQQPGIPASYRCAKFPAGIPAGIPQLIGRFQKHLMQCPAVPAP